VRCFRWPRESIGRCSASTPTDPWKAVPLVPRPDEEAAIQHDTPVEPACGHESVGQRLHHAIREEPEQAPAEARRWARSEPRGAPRRSADSARAGRILAPSARVAAGCERRAAPASPFLSYGVVRSHRPSSIPGGHAYAVRA
jgi:hypothetical protein